MSHIRILPSYFHSPPPAPPYVPPVRVNTMYADDLAGSPPANAWIKFATTGGVTGGQDIFNSPFTWLIEGAASDYDIRYVRTGGSVASLGGMANNTWYNLNTDRTMVLLCTGEIATETFAATVSIKYNANSTIIASNTADWWASTDV